MSVTRSDSYGSAAALARQIGIHASAATRYRRNLCEHTQRWAERILIIRAIPRWCYEMKRRDRIALKILELSAGLEGRVFAMFADPELLVSNDPAEMIEFAREQNGVRTICVSEVLKRKVRRS